MTLFKICLRCGATWIPWSWQMQYTCCPSCRRDDRILAKVQEKMARGR